ncbi:MAG: hypothetical protein KDE15_14240 [Erythrobacter sp.]|nr:hypothetical protein [Erythrobacter sp.]
MDPIIDSIDRLEAIVGQFQAVARRADKHMVSDILSLRTTYANEIMALFAAVKDDPRLKANPAIAARFQSNFMDARHRISNMQLRWKTADIERDPHGYLKDLMEIEAHSAGLRQWGRQALQGKAA